MGALSSPETGAKPVVTHVLYPGNARATAYAAADPHQPQVKRLRRGGCSLWLQVAARAGLAAYTMLRVRLVKLGFPHRLARGRLCSLCLYLITCFDADIQIGVVVSVMNLRS